MRRAPAPPTSPPGWVAAAATGTRVAAAGHPVGLAPGSVEGPSRAADPAPSTPHPDPATTGERGGGSSLALAIIGATLALLSAAALLGTVVLATHRARTAADLAALSAATRLLRGGDARSVCALARHVADENGARLTECTTSGSGRSAGDTPASSAVAARGAAGSRVLGESGSVRIVAAVALPRPLTRFGPARASAVAGSSDLQPPAWAGGAR